MTLSVPTTAAVAIATATGWAIPNTVVTAGPNVTTFTDDTAPTPMTPAERKRRYRAKQPERERVYEQARSAGRKRPYVNRKTWENTTDHYLSRPFIAWDGEGIGQTPQIYTLLANSLGESRRESHGLASRACLNMVLNTARNHPDAIHVIYGGGYDFNMWFADFTREELEQVYKGGFVVLRGLRLMWRPGKSLFISDDTTSVTIYDIVSFFQCPFVNALESYLGDQATDLDLIRDMKKLRGTFDRADDATVKRYNKAELDNTVALITEARKRFNNAGLRPKRWDGPGALAAALLVREKVKQHMGKVPDRVATAARFAYAGGRFEVVRFGHVDGPAYEYDINSAYPSALRNVPSLSVGSWTHYDGAYASRQHERAAPFALYHLTFTGGNPALPGPLFRRDKKGNICYPTRVTGWYWTPEYEAARLYVEKVGGTLTVLESWAYEPATDVRPFAYIDGLYKKRQALKRAGDGAHVGLKLAMNSTYGKLAQQVGWKPPSAKYPLRLPPYHQLEWAGYITSAARALVLRATLHNPGAIIAYETDALFSSEPLPLPLSDELGEWSETRFKNLTYVQSGLYFGETTDGAQVVKTRGVDRGSLSRDDVVDALRRGDVSVPATLTRFVGAGVALAQSFDRWRCWETVPKNLILGPQGKRDHAACSNCKDDDRLTLELWHHTVCPFVRHEHSTEFPVEWINPNPDMTELDEARRGSYEQWDSEYD